MGPDVSGHDGDGYQSVHETLCESCSRIAGLAEGWSRRHCFAVSSGSGLGEKTGEEVTFNEFDRSVWMKTRRCLRWLCAGPAALLLVWGSVTKAQTFRGTILGVVTDSSGAAIAGAKVTVRNVDTGVERTTETQADGSYRVPELPIGTYKVTVEKLGFQTAVTTGVAVSVASERVVDAVVKPGEVIEQVVISADTLSQVEKTNDTLGGTLTAQTVKDLPVNGRDYTKLMFLTPGVTDSPDRITDSPRYFGIFSINGARGRANNFPLDGTDMNHGHPNDPAANDAR